MPRGLLLILSSRGLQENLVLLFDFNMNMILHQISFCEIDGGRFIQNINWKLYIIMDCFVWCYCYTSNQYSGLNLEENRTKTMKQATSPVCLVLIACQVTIVGKLFYNFSNLSYV